jgi:acetylornithine deacetylase/succinyl-diaminopimelate desuccinylase-like protein
LAEVEGIADEKTVVRIPVYDRASYKGTVFTQSKYYPTWKMPADHAIVQTGTKAYSLLFGEPPRIDKWTFSTNGVAIRGRHQIPCIGFGPGNEIYAHAPNEAIPIDHLVRAAAFYALLPYSAEGELS